jgi:hypothetical protein
MTRQYSSVFNWEQYRTKLLKRFGKLALFGGCEAA